LHRIDVLRLFSTAWHYLNRGDIPRLKAFEKAAAAGVPVSAVDDPRAKRAWEAYEAAGKELVTHV